MGAKATRKPSEGFAKKANQAHRRDREEEQAKQQEKGKRQTYASVSPASVGRVSSFVRWSAHRRRARILLVLWMITNDDCSQRCLINLLLQCPCPSSPPPDKVVSAIAIQWRFRADSPLSSRGTVIWSSIRNSDVHASRALFKLLILLTVGSSTPAFALSRTTPFSRSRP